MGDTQSLQTERRKPPRFFDPEFGARIIGGIIGVTSLYLIGHFGPSKIPDKWIGLFSVSGFVIGQSVALMVFLGPPLRKAARNAASVAKESLWLLMFAAVTAEPAMLLVFAVALLIILPILWATEKGEKRG